MTQKRSKLQHQEREGQSTHPRQASSARGEHEFESAEAAIRQDASNTRVPEAVEERLSQSVRESPKPRRSWWRRLRGG